MTRDIVKAAKRAAELSALLSQIASNAIYSYEYDASLVEGVVFRDLERELCVLMQKFEAIHRDAEGKHFAREVVDDNIFIL